MPGPAAADCQAAPKLTGLASVCSELDFQNAVRDSEEAVRHSDEDFHMPSRLALLVCCCVDSLKQLM